MSVSPGPALQTRVDEFSYQVSAQSDRMFWFRLERHADRDVITDFYIGSFSRQQSGALLAECYKALDLAPRSTIVFRDILSGKDETPAAVKEAEDFYLEAGKSLLVEFGTGSVESAIQRSQGKVDLVLVGTRADT
jgi:hypothetical protein